MSQALLQHGISIPPHMSQQARELIACALASGQPERAKAIAEDSWACLSIEDVDSKPLGNFLQQRRDVVVVGHAHDAAAAAALDEEVFVARP